MITELLRKRNRILFLGFWFLAACSSQQEVLGAKWTGDSDFMFITENEMKMQFDVRYFGALTGVEQISSDLQLIRHKLFLL